MSPIRRVRLFLLTVAIVPPLIVLVALYVTGQSRAKDDARNWAVDRLRHAQFLITSEQQKLIDMAPVLAAEFMSGGAPDPEVWRRSGVDFAELCDSSFTVLRSMSRPGLLNTRVLSGRQVQQFRIYPTFGGFFVSDEADQTGLYAGLTTVLQLSDNRLLYVGRYLKNDYLTLIAASTNTQLNIVQRRPQAIHVRGKEILMAFSEGNAIVGELVESLDQDRLLEARIELVERYNALGNLIGLVSLVAVFSIGLAIFFGWRVGRSVQREVDNLVEASRRLSRGEFDTPVMAYEAGEFEQLADALSDAMARLKKLRTELAASERIAAWQLVGRKMAHEIRNPLSPIAIRLDDLRLSYREGRADFGQTFADATLSVREEIGRINGLLDQFSRFAQMAPPSPRHIVPAEVIHAVRGLFAHDSAAGRVVFNLSSYRPALVDPAQLQQVLINLIKNGLESDPGAEVSVDWTQTETTDEIRIADTGPGFAVERIANPVQPFRSTKANGTGLGLVISYRIIIDHGGSMELANNPQKGARVTLTLPYNGHGTHPDH